MNILNTYNKFIAHSSRLIALSLLFAFSFTAFSQESISSPDDSLKNVKKNISIILGTEAVLYAGSMTGLYYLWYADYPH